MKLYQNLVAMAVIAAGMAVSTAASAFVVFPGCESPSVKERIPARFNAAEIRLLDPVQINRIDHEAERATEALGPSPILRRYCRARALLDSGHYRTIHYLIEDPMGLAGVGWNVEFCLDGHDRWRVYDGFCRVLRR